MTDQLPAAFSRRTAIKLAAASAAVFGLGGLSACATGGSGSSTTETSAPAGETSADNPLGVDKAAPLDYVIFNGGYGDQYGAEHIKLYNAWAGAEVAKMTSTVKIGSTLQPRFAGGNPPDVIDNSGADQMPTATLAGQKQLADLKPLLEAPTVDDPNVKIADVLLPGAIESGSFDGVFHVMNYVFSMWGFWNSSSLFSEKGWEPAKTWDDFMALSDKIKGTGLAPFIHTGVHTQYMAVVITTMAAQHGGPDILKKVDNLEPDGWTNDSMLAAAKAWEAYAKEGYIFKGSEGIDHTTSQTEWLLGEAAIIPVGSWLENEMKGKVPDGFDMVVTPFPSLTGSDQMPFGIDQRRCRRAVHRRRTGQEPAGRDGVPAADVQQGRHVEVRRADRQPGRGQGRRRQSDQPEHRAEVGGRCGLGGRGQHLLLPLQRLVRADAGRPEGPGPQPAAR